MTQLAHTAPVDSATLAGLTKDVYPIGDVVAPTTPLADVTTAYADAVPRAFTATALKLKRAVVGDDTVTATVLVNGVAVASAIPLIGLNTTVVLAAVALAENARVEVTLVVVGEEYITRSMGLRMDFLGQWA